jgi:hypothetical protein
VLAVLAGALFLDRSQQLVPVYAAARDLPAGTSLQDGDLVVIRVRLPASALRHYLRPSAGRRVAGGVLTAPVRRETLVPAGFVLTSSRDADLVELPVQVDPGDMAQGLRPGDSVQVLAAYTEGARRGRAVVLLPTAEVVQVLQDPAGLTATGQERGVQLRMPSDRAPIVAAAIATARIFVVKSPGVAAEEPSAAPTPGGTQGPPPQPSEPGLSDPDASVPDLSEPGTAERGTAEPGASGPAAAEPGTAEPGTSEPDAPQPGAAQPGGSLRDGGRPAPTSPNIPGGTRPTAARAPRGSGR